MGTTALTKAADIMDRSAILMNDPAKTDYTYAVVMPYLNMAIDELNEYMEESNMPTTNQTLYTDIVSVGQNAIVNPPTDMVEIQEVAEKSGGSEQEGPFRILPRREFIEAYPITNSLIFWCWQNRQIMFNPDGANMPMQIQLKYIRSTISPVYNPDTVIEVVNSVSFLSYKTAALCAMFIGENEARAQILQGQADLALERMVGIGNKGKQQIMTRHRPFRAAYKMRSF